MTYANVAMTLALVFAMTGGALAASHKGKHAQRHKKSGVTITSTKQISKGVLAALKGNTGPAGPQGPAGTPGTAGAKGETGPEGKVGKDGTNGKSVLAAEEAPGKNCAEGGTSLEEEGAGVKHYACNGKRGANGLSVTMTELAKGSTECEEGGEEFTIGTEKGKACNGLNGVGGSGGLKKGETERGMWNLHNSANAEYPEYVTVTYPRPLAPGTHLVSQDAHVVHGKEPTAECPGSVSKPEAAEGYLCLYYQNAGNIGTIVGSNWGEEEKYIGFLIRGISETAAKEGAVFGSWAVTAG